VGSTAGEQLAPAELWRRALRGESRAREALLARIMPASERPAPGAILTLYARDERAAA
jgi:hypothetical protein